MELDDPIGLINLLQKQNAKLQQQVNSLENQCNEYQQRLEFGDPSYASSFLKSLRSYGVIPLYVGYAGEAKTFSDMVSKAVLDSPSTVIWSLERAPIPDEAKAALKKAANGGLDKWC
ncbi:MULTISPECIES: hypothetical protein [Herbaspirillum]|uniref:Uncharacterized protein n=2 Tax=Herbaspirillum huttiense TaxID=863372 RepID=A0AAJ2LSA8_9BURK|nr:MULTISPECIES: hypothetical protein [Herbaspirillum]MDR9836989.1 hypothetical protein [Herbaspirillum huttiense]